MIKTFFEQLSQYYSLENDLSNIVVALCNSSREFRERFVRFFFPDLDVDSIEAILREVPDPNNLGSRVDIYISLSGDTKPYIIEVKKGDRSHHFGQYEEAYGIGKERFGYITNCACSEGKKAGYDVRTWEEFYDYLVGLDSADELLTGFASYLKNVCGIIKFYQPMNLTGLSSIPCFVETVKKIIAKDRDWISTSFYREYSYSSSIHEGFLINVPQCADSGFAVFGLWFREKPVITICINARPWLSERIISDRTNVLETTRISNLPYRDGFWDKNDVWFELSDEMLQAFTDAASYDEQRTILEKFFEEVMGSIRKYF